jgi:hypothetical protein
LLLILPRQVAPAIAAPRNRLVPAPGLRACGAIRAIAVGMALAPPSVVGLRLVGGRARRALERGDSVLKVRSVVLAAAGCVFVSGSLLAQTGTGTMMLSKVNGNSSCYSTDPSGAGGLCAYTSPYFGQFTFLKNLDGVPSWQLPAGGYAPSTTFGPSEDVFCVDFLHESSVGQVAPIYLTNLGDLGGHSYLGTYTRNTSLESYLEAAWLAQQIRSVGVNSTAALEINGAIWQIMTGSTFYRQVGSTWYNDYNNIGIKYWRDLAVGNWNGTSENGVTASEWVVVTPQGPNGVGIGDSQEYLTQVTPEPATMILLGSGLMIMMLGGGVIRRHSA